MYDYNNMQTSSRTYRPIRKSSDSQSRQSVNCPSSYPLNRAQCLQPPCGSWQATGKPSLTKSFVPVRPDGIPKLSGKSALPSTKQTKNPEVSPALPVGIVALTPPLSSSMKPNIVIKPPFRYQSPKSPDKYLISPSNAPSTSAPVSIASYAPEPFFTRLPQSSIASSLRSFQPSLQTTTPPLPVVNYPSSTMSPTSDVTGEITYYYNYATSSSPSIDILPITLVPMAPLLPPSTALPSLQPPLATSAPVISQSASPTDNVVSLASQKTSSPSNNALQGTDSLSPQSPPPTKSYNPAQAATILPFSMYPVQISKSPVLNDTTKPSIQTMTPPLSVASTLAPSEITNIINYPSSTMSPTSDVTGEITYYYNYATSSSPSIDILPITLVPMAPLLPPSTALPSLQPPLATSAPVISQSASPTDNVVSLASQKTSSPSNNALQGTDAPSPKVTLSPIEILRTTKPRPVMKFKLPFSPSLSQAPLRQPFPKSTQSAPPSRKVPGMMSFTTLQNIYRSFYNTNSMS